MIVVFTGVMYIISPYFSWILVALILSLYPVLHLFFYRNVLYKNIMFNAKMYVIGKRIQFVFELTLLPYIVFNWGWNSEAIHTAALVYAAPHTAALVMCNYPYVETLRHLIILMLSILYQYEDFEDDSAARCGVVYGCFSCLLFWVHHVLAERQLRYVSVRTDLYLGTCVCNWLWQFWYLLHHDMNLWGIVWVSCLVVLVNSDLILWKRLVEL